MSDPTVLTAADLVELVAPVLDTSLLGFDIDGVLAPIVEHADQSQLQPGVWEALATLAPHTRMLVLSGRSLESLERLFEFPESVLVIGSHGLEERGLAAFELTDVERYRLEQVTILGNKAVEAVGDGAWLEEKVASVALHTRAADPAKATPAVAALQRLAGLVEGVQIKPGSEVIELLARAGDKGTTLRRVAAREDRIGQFFIGDDVTDEDAFLALNGLQISVRVGPGATAARYRLPDAATAATFVRRLAQQVVA